MQRSAVISECLRYRYILQRTWDSNASMIMFVGLNPSTADGQQDDPTVRRCIAFAKAWGFGGLYLTNLFAFRATHPPDLFAASDPIGPENDAWLQQTSSKVSLSIAAWGGMGSEAVTECKVAKKRLV